jgi:hypothetical protein
VVVDGKAWELFEVGGMFRGGMVLLSALPSAATTAKQEGIVKLHDNYHCSESLTYWDQICIFGWAICCFAIVYCVLDASIAVMFWQCYSPDLAYITA